MALSWSHLLRALYFSCEALLSVMPYLLGTRISTDPCRVRSTFTGPLGPFVVQYICGTSISLKLQNYPNNISFLFIHHTKTSETIVSSNASHTFPRILHYALCSEQSDQDSTALTSRTSQSTKCTDNYNPINAEQMNTPKVRSSMIKVHGQHE